MATQNFPPGTYGPQTPASNDVFLAIGGPALTHIVDTGGYYTFGVNINDGVNHVQIGDLSGHGFDIQATNPGGTAVQVLGDYAQILGNTLTANDANGNGADLITGPGADHLNVQGNQFLGTGFALAYVNGALDTYTSSQDVNFVNNTFNGTSTAGVDLVFDAASGNISGNTFINGTADEAAIYLGHLSRASSDYFNDHYGTTYQAEAGTITLANNTFTNFAGPDIITFDADFDFGNGGAGHTLTSTVDSSGKETLTLVGYRSGDNIDLNHSVTATRIVQNGKGEVDVYLSDNDLLIVKGDNIKAKDVAADLGSDLHVNNGNHYGADHGNHFGWDHGAGNPHADGFLLA